MEDSALLELIVTNLCRNPVRIEKSQDQLGVLFTVYPVKSDMGSIIGKEGTTANSIRTIMRVFGSQREARISVKFIEPI